MIGFLRRIRNWIPRRTPLFYAVRYVEGDGSREIDIKKSLTSAQSAADWCRRDGCTSITITPLWSEQEVAGARRELEDCEKRIVLTM